MLSKIVRNIMPSATCELEGVVQDMLANQIDVIGLNAGEPDFYSPENVQLACKKAIDEGKTHYVNVRGIKELREEICRKLRSDNQVEYTPEQICVSTGAKQALNNAVMSVVNPGDEVIIPTPCWVSYIEIAKLVGAVPVCVPTFADYQLDVDAIEKAVTDKTAAVIINTPNNPTGAVYGRDSLERLIRLAAERGFYIISDEVYEKLVYNGAEHVCVSSLSEEAYEHSIIINGVSKAYAMTGYRLGYTAAPLEIAQGIGALQGHTTSNSTTFVQYAALEALRNSAEDSAAMVQEFAKRKDYTYKRLTAMKGITCENVNGAFYLMPNVSSYYGSSYDGKVIRDSFDFCGYILNTAHVALVPGGAFMAPECVRVAYTNSMDQIREGLDRIEVALARLSIVDDGRL